MIIKTRSKFNTEKVKPCLGMGKVAKFNRALRDAQPSTVKSSVVSSTTEDKITTIRNSWIAEKSVSLDTREAFAKLWK